MSKTNFKQTFINGLFFALPLLGIVYLAIKILGMVETIISPAAEKLGVDRIIGEVTLVVFAIIILLIICWILGMLLQANLLRGVNKQIEEIAYKFIPQLDELKSLAADDDDNTFESGWKTVLLEEGDSWTPAYITEGNEQWLTIFLPEAPDGKSGQLKLLPASAAHYIPIDGIKFRAIVHRYGHGLIEAKNNIN